MRTASASSRISRLSVVFFGAVSISRIYRSLEFCGRDATPGYASFSIDAAQLVKECTFKEWILDDDRGPWASNFLDLYLRAVRRMPNIESIHLKSTPITENVVRAITKSTPSLTTLTIRSCTIETGISEKSRQRLNSLNLHTLEYFPLSSASLELPPSTIRLRGLEVFRTNSWTFGHYFIKRQHPALHILELHGVEDIPALFAFLAKCPSITDLAINTISLASREPFPALSPAALPNLRMLKIPPTFLPNFSRRPLNKFSLEGAEMRHLEGDIYHNPILPLLTMKDMSPLMSSATSLTELHIHEHIYFALPLHKHFKNLEILVLAYHHPNFFTSQTISTSELFRQTIRSICSKWPEPPHLPLREFRMDFGESTAADARPFMWDLPLQLEMIIADLSLRATFPVLTSVSFARFLKWQRWDEHCAEWRAFVPHAFREFVKDKLARGRKFKDFGGCLDALDYK
ncbi:hypothetical protein B0H11DRAFT_2233451 [Mycena galericulata]|nr:hypothetical protein B0H11DRAFT_2233451 [Mycena galericulata]